MKALDFSKLESFVENKDSVSILAMSKEIDSQSEAIYFGINLGYQLIDDQDFSREILESIGIFRAVADSLKNIVEKALLESNQAVIKSLQALPSAAHALWAVLYLVELLAQSSRGIKRLAPLAAIALKH